MQETVNYSTLPGHLLVDGLTTEICTYLLYCFISQTIALFGVFTNIINIMCFMKQGFSETINISLLGLTISDLGCLVTLILTIIFITPAFTIANLPFDVLGVYYLTIGTSHLAFSRVYTWITAIITLERCLCIIAPLQIKSILSTRRMFVIIICTYIILVSSGAPMYAVNRLDMFFSPWRNKTILGLVPTADRESVEKMSFIVNSFFLPFFAFFVIIVCTIILVISLLKRISWRKKSISTSKNDVNSRNLRVAKMVVMISTLFICSFIPMAIIALARTLEPELDLYGKHLNISIIVGGISVLTESINSSGNIFIYYSMSVKYRETFNYIFCKERSKNN